MTKINKRNYYIFELAVIAMCVALLSVSAWIAIPILVNFTLQTLVLFTISALFGLKISLVSVVAYILLGLCGLPIFSAFGAGPPALFGPTGGYILGFIFIPLAVNLFPRSNKLTRFFSMLCGLLLCYLFGTLWYAFGYSNVNGGVFAVLSVCVIPFIIPDIIKILIALSISQRLDKHISINRLGGRHEK